MNDVIELPKSALSTTHHPRLSERYVQINTRDVVEMMQQEGFVVASAQGAKSRKADPLFSKHQIDLRLPDAPNVEGAVPRVIFTNSHDGSTSAKFMMGVYRFVCSNGLVIGSTYAREVVRHSGEQAAQLIDRVRKLAANTGPLFSQIDAWGKRELTEGEAAEFASLAAVLRFGDVQRFDPRQLLGTHRADDEGRTLWRVFNRVQENAMRGGLVGYSADGRQLASRPLRNIDQSTQFNTQLWRLAEEFAQ
jgi:hypothetical protein